MSGVFIASLAHSGSTLLDLLLGSHPRLVSLGEIHATVTRFAEPQNVCTCGQPATNCAVWGPVHGAWKRDPQRPYSEFYALVLDQVRALYGGDVAHVDSSKHVPTLAALHHDQRKQLRAVFLVKDVRSLVASENRRELPWTMRYRNTTLFNVARWYHFNRQLERYLDRERLPRFQLGYEELCFRPGPMLKKVCGFLGLPFDESMLAPTGERAHILRGNHMRFDREKRAIVSYDARWMMSTGAVWNGLWYLPVMGFNRRHVYSNLAAAEAR